jgi:SAM-dependent methyltransferase
MTTWDERFRTGTYPHEPDPSAILERYLAAAPTGRALDVATGTGRNAVFLAERGYRVEAIDQSRVGLEIARENARERGVGSRTAWIQTDVPSYGFPEERYDVIAISFYRPLDRLPDIKRALKPGGLLFVEHHLRTTDHVEGGPPGDRYRFASNELLGACLDMTVLHYDEGRRAGGRSVATARIVARESTGRKQSYPAVDAPR